jgi:flagellar hook assembly protein FlgD
MTGSFTARHPRLARALATIFVALAALLVAVWVAPRASGAAASWIRTPSVRLHTLAPPGDGRLAVAGPTGRGAGAPVTLDPGMRFSMAGVICDPSAAGAAIRLRTSVDGAAWGPWLEAPLELAGEGAHATAFTDAVWTGPSRYVQVTALTGAQNGPAALTGVRLVAIDPTEDSSVAARVTGVARRFAATVAGVSLDSPAAAAAAAPVIVTRAQWGADESLRNAAPSYSPVKMTFVHHTASGNLYSRADAPALVRGVYAYHTQSLHWNDIAYNFLVDRFGTIYEGRYGGITRGVIGAHVYGFNTGSTGVSVMGTFTDEAPPAEALAALERLLAWKLGVHGLNPAATAKLTCGAADKYAKGATVTLPVIAGHRQANYTECPGTTFNALLPSVRANVVKRMGATVAATLSVSAPLISPNGDGVLDTTSLDVGITTAADWKLDVRDAGGQTVASWDGQGAAASVTWNGTSGGAGVPDGVYTAELTATLTSGEPATTSAQITVDTAAPRLSGAAAPDWFSPNGDRQTETATVSFTPAEACAVRVGILDADGDVLRWLHGWRTREARSYSVAWDGRISSAAGLAPAPDGQYRFDVERRDAAGNIARQGIKITVDRTVGFPAAVPGTFSPGEDGAMDTTALGFKLTRKATVTVRILSGSDVVRTLSLGTLAAGAHSATWDGRAGSGEYLASSRPTWAVTAVSSLGESSVRKTVVIDLYRPRLYAASGRTASRGARVRLTYKAVDPFSARVDMRYIITNAKGRRVASGHPGWQATGKSLSITWRPASRGVYTVTYRAVDRGGNREAVSARTIVTVR